MKVKLVSIGNSKGVRIPRSVIKDCGFGDEVEMRVDDGVVLLAPARAARAGWDEAVEKMAAAGDDAPVLPGHLAHDRDAADWVW